MAGKRIYLEVDASDMNEKIMRLQAVMKPEQFEKAMYGVFKRTGGHVKTILKKDIPPKYNVKPGEVGSTVKAPNVTMGAGGVGCSIPVTGPRKHIGGGGRGFTAYGSRKGWASLHSGHYDVTAVIYRGQRSTLPAKMSSYGGMPPFRNVPSSLHGLTFTRSGKPRLPIEAVMGIAIPQMPLNRAEPAVQKDIAQYMEGRVAARLQALIANGR